MLKFGLIFLRLMEGIIDSMLHGRCVCLYNTNNNFCPLVSYNYKLVQFAEFIFNVFKQTTAKMAR